MELFTTFFRIGLFTLGGGYAMIPLIEAEVVDKRKWIDKTLFLDLIAIAQSCPGVFAINLSIFIGYRMKGVKGALLTTASSNRTGNSEVNVGVPVPSAPATCLPV